MAISKKNVLLKFFSGQIGKQVVVKSHKNGIILAKYPDMSKAGKSEKQDKARKLFKKAQAYAKAIISDPEKKAAYQKELKDGKTVYHTLISEYMKANKPTDS